MCRYKTFIFTVLSFWLKIIQQWVLNNFFQLIPAVAQKYQPIFQGAVLQYRTMSWKVGLANNAWLTFFLIFFNISHAHWLVFQPKWPMLDWLIYNFIPYFKTNAHFVYLVWLLITRFLKCYMYGRLIQHIQQIQVATETTDSSK